MIVHSLYKGVVKTKKKILDINNWIFINFSKYIGMRKISEKIQ